MEMMLNSKSMIGGSAAGSLRSRGSLTMRDWSTTDRRMDFVGKRRQSYYTVSEKGATTFLPNISLSADRLSKFFTDRQSSKFLTKRQLNFPPHLKRVATLPCEIFITVNQRQRKRSAKFEKTSTLK